MNDSLTHNQTIHLDPYKYGPLGPERALRLLRRIEDPRDGLMSFELRAYSVDEAAGQYLAISYTWGSKEAVKTIVLNGRAFRITENAHYALWQCGLHHYNCLTWIDSVCINQDDMHEKSVQVAQMADVFQKAKYVCVCIGPHADGSQSLKDIFAWLQEDDDLSLWRYLEAGDEQTWASKMRSKAAHADEHAWIEHLLPVYKAFAWLMYRPYWKRAWIVQEITVAANQGL